MGVKSSSKRSSAPRVWANSSMLKGKGDTVESGRPCVKTSIVGTLGEAVATRDKSWAWIQPRHILGLSQTQIGI